MDILYKNYERNSINMVSFIKFAILIYAAPFAFAFAKDCYLHRKEFTRSKSIPLSLIGYFSDLLDTWGIGSFATCQAAFKFTGSCADENMPGTLTVGHAIPTITEFLLFLHAVRIENTTLIPMIAGAVIGGIYGASIVSKWSPKLIRLALGSALLILAAVLSLKLAEIGPFAPSAAPAAMTEENVVYGLRGSKLIIGIIGNTLLGALMTIGVGLYAPCMALVSALGINVTAAFPIMMGSSAFLMPSAGMKFIRSGRYDRKAAALLTLFGVPGVFTAYKAASAIPLDLLTGIVICVMVYTAFTFFRDAAKS